MAKYDENSIRQLDYREAVRNSIGMYIGNSDASGMERLLIEIVANSTDEAINGFGKVITVKLDTAKNQIAVIDNGRGIPFKKNKEGKFAIVEVCTGLHAGGKFENQGNYKTSLGLNGVGASVVNALSSYYAIDSNREDGSCHLEFNNGKMTPPQFYENKSKKTGSTVTFIPDAEIFHGLKWDLDTIRSDLQTQALLNNNIEYCLYVDGKLDHKWVYSNGVIDIFKLKRGDKRLLTDPIYGSNKLTNDSGTECVIEYCFSYTDSAQEQIWSYVNGGYTSNGGTHVTGWKTGYTKFINKLAEKNFSGDIIRRGMILVLKLQISEHLQFAEQTKQTLTSPSAKGFCMRASGLISLNERQKNAILKHIENEQKVEEAAQRKREAQEKITHGGSKLNALKDLPEKLADATDFEDAEIFFCEGDSAAAGLKEMKKPNMAVMPLRGKIKNATELETTDILKSETVTNILNCLGCGIGDHFNIKNLRYKRILLLFDADPDGGHIENLFLTLCLHFLPELINQGKVYAIRSPIYRIITARKETMYFYDEAEAKKWMKTHTGYKAQHYKGLGELSAEELYETSMNPSVRHEIQLTTADVEKTLKLYEVLMGNSPSSRRQFIMSHKLSNYPSDEDYCDDEEDEE